MKFDWDENKAVSNRSKHGIGFEEAKTIFDDPLYVDFYDPDHSDEEERYLMIESQTEGVCCLFRTQRREIPFVSLVPGKSPDPSEKRMKKDNPDLEDELRSEYDLKHLRVRKLGAGRKSFGGAVIRLEPDVAEMFPSADAVNEALRFLIRVMQENQSSASKPHSNEPIGVD